MHFRSVATLSTDLARTLHRLPSDLDLVVGIPRSGMIPASLVALHRNLPLADLDGFLAGRTLAVGTTRRGDRAFVDAREARHVLLVDDSVSSGTSMREAQARLAQAGVTARVTTFAPYVVPGLEDAVDVWLESVPLPRVFAWNVLHRSLLDRMGLDIDGVLCADPTPEQNDDGPRYRRFVREAPVLVAPSHPIGGLVTNRLTAYRPETEAWLAEHGIRYGRLEMLDLPDAAARRAQGDYGAFKADVYRRSDWVLFVESEPRQAVAIARGAGKPVLCWETQTLVGPGAAAWKSPATLGRRIARRVKRDLLATVRRVRGPGTR